MLTRWKDGGDHKPVEVECPDGLWPNDDADGERIFENSHFETRSECVDRMKAEAEAGVRLAGSRVELARQSLQNEERDAAQAAVVFEKVSRLKS